MYLRQYHVAHGLSLSVKVLKRFLLHTDAPTDFSHTVIFS